MNVIVDLKTVALAPAGVHAEYASQSCVLNMDPRWREDDEDDGDDGDDGDEETR